MLRIFDSCIFMNMFVVNVCTTGESLSLGDNEGEYSLYIYIYIRVCVCIYTCVCVYLPEVGIGITICRLLYTILVSFTKWFRLYSSGFFMIYIYMYIYISELCDVWHWRRCIGHRMMTSSYGNIFCVTGPLCGEFAGYRWIPHTKASGAELWCFPWSAPEQRLSKQSRGWWFEMPSWSLWRHCNGLYNRTGFWACAVLVLDTNYSSSLPMFLLLSYFYFYWDVYIHGHSF